VPVSKKESSEFQRVKDGPVFKHIFPSTHINRDHVLESQSQG
jgi:hypothetical protein